MLTSPCDAIVGASGTVDGDVVIQAKGLSYTLHDLLDDPVLERLYRDGRYVTLRLTSSMYHRFHAPYDCRVVHLNYFSGDTWNTNPIAVNRVEKLYCKNEHAVIQTKLPAGHLVTLVPVASILVASIRLRFLDVPLHLAYDGPRAIVCDAAFAKGEEMGWFELGSTIIVFAPDGFALADGVAQGKTIKMGSRSCGSRDLTPARLRPPRPGAGWRRGSLAAAGRGARGRGRGRPAASAARRWRGRARASRGAHAGRRRADRRRSRR